MKKKILDSIINIIKKYNNYDDVKLLEIRYGLETIYLTLFKLIVVILIAYFIHTLKELGLFFLLYLPLRLTGFGVHAKKAWHCWISTLPTFGIIPYLIKIKFLSRKIIIPLFFILLILIIIYAPADTEKRPLIRKNRRIIYKILTSITTLTYLIITLYYDNLYVNNLLIFSVLLECIFILPITYKLFGAKYNNYKVYKRKEVIK